MWNSIQSVPNLAFSYTEELQWLESLWNHENMFETGVVRDIFSVLFIMKVCCVFLLVSPYQGDSNEYTYYTI